MSVTHHTPEWSRRLNVRSTGLFRKAAELTKLENVQVTILISSNGYSNSFLGHGADDWSGLHQMVLAQSDKVATPDDFTTVSQHNAKRLQAASSTAISSNAANDAAPDLLAKRLAALEKELRTISAATLLPNADSSSGSSPVSEQGEVLAQRCSTPRTSETTPEPHEAAMLTQTVLEASCSAPDASGLAVTRILSAGDGRVQKRNAPRRQALGRK
ncbi:hypothetical protein NLG97_g4322 [Lecanicillium saksenae]|uniref:Uncharacterized protein n=1 Tax=Lecanicillium saksenae TaxID=468837 RepID=A0ACC1QWY0_9HYPO|nr:hypothetical protein NLG97_g4322 [Lecanicillium saksenae]